LPTALTYVDHLTAMLGAHLIHRYNAVGSAAPAMPAVARLEQSQLDDRLCAKPGSLDAGEIRICPRCHNTKQSARMRESEAFT
jgi:hypothetical protein